ncbi:MAG TPA: hypothetical protein VH186_24210 [Chloroflexia bacterium]|nr:hypothetical protein [Chloroflexia bacterium]
MERLDKSEHEHPDTPIESLHKGEKFLRIKEMIELPEDEVSATIAPHEAPDRGLPLMLFFLIGMMVFFGLVMGVIWLGIGNETVQIILGNHFMK